MLSEWQGEDCAEDEAATASCSVDVEPIVVEEPAVTVEERDAIDDREFFLDKQTKSVKGRPNFRRRVAKQDGISGIGIGGIGCQTGNEITDLMGCNK